MPYNIFRSLTKILEEFKKTYPGNDTFPIKELKSKVQFEIGIKNPKKIDDYLNWMKQNNMIRMTEFTFIIISTKPILLDEGDNNNNINNNNVAN